MNHHENVSHNGSWPLTMEERHDEHGLPAFPSAHEIAVANQHSSGVVHEDQTAELSVVPSSTYYSDQVSPDHYHQMQAELVESRQTTVVLTTAIQQMAVMMHDCLQSIYAVIPGMANMQGGQGFSGGGNTNPVSFASNTAVLGRPRTSKSGNHSRNRRPKSGRSAESFDAQVPALSSTSFQMTEGTTQKSQSKTNKALTHNGPYWGKGFLEFAVQHYQIITTGWTPQRYAQGRPSKERAYASIISLLAFYYQFDKALFKEHFQAASELKNRDKAELHYKNLLDAKKAYDCNAGHYGGDKNIRPLLQNEIQFQPYAVAYIECFGSLQKGEFVLFETPRELTPDIVAQINGTFASHGEVEAPASYQTVYSPQQHHQDASNQSMPHFDGYAQADISAYASTHKNTMSPSFQTQSPHAPSIVLESDNDSCADLLRAPLSTSEKVEKKRTTRKKSSHPKTLSDQNLAETEQVSTIVPTDSQMDVTVASNAPAKSGRKKRSRSDAESTHHHREPETGQSNADHDRGGEKTLEEPAPKKKTVKGRIVNADGTITVLAVEPGMTIYRNKLMTLESAMALKKAAAQKKLEAQQQQQESHADPPPSSSTTVQPADDTHTVEKTMSTRVTRKNAEAKSAYKPVPKTI